MQNEFYQSFLSTQSHKQWAHNGIQKRAGVATPLFSLYSKNSIGIGEIQDLKKLVDWCQKTSMSIIQLLPMNDVGFDFRPYDAQSSFALEPMYLSLSHLRGMDLAPFKKEIKKLGEKFPAGKGRIDYRIKGAKLELLWKIFQSGGTKDFVAMEDYERANRFWLRDYALFKAVKERFGQAGWESWPDDFKCRNQNVLDGFGKECSQSVRFHQWLQWQLFEQFKDVSKYARSKNILLMGDLPFLVSRDSADVWARQDYFKLDRVSGAPPDDYYAKGQRWGMPPYRWEHIAQHGYDYLIEKLKYAENFYDLYRIDHVVGTFRIWTIALNEPPEHEGQNGVFDPSEESVWEEHGKKILNVSIENTRMLACAEDLGVVPECAPRVLQDGGIPGMNVQRWTKDWGGSYDFLNPEDYRKNSIAVISTHDMSSFRGWWKFEAGTIDELRFKRQCGCHNLSYEEIKEALFDLDRSHYGRLRWKSEICSEGRLLAVLRRPKEEVRDIVDYYLGTYDEKKRFWRYAGLKGDCPEESTPRLVESAFSKVHASASIFSVQLLQDWLSLGDSFCEDPWEFRINFPGTMSDKNWSIGMPLSLEEMNQMKINDKIKALNQKADRI